MRVLTCYILGEKKFIFRPEPAWDWGLGAGDSWVDDASVDFCVCRCFLCMRLICNELEAVLERFFDRKFRMRHVLWVFPVALGCDFGGWVLHSGIDVSKRLVALGWGWGCRLLVE